MKNDLFVHQSLGPFSDEVRFFDLLPGAEEEPLRCIVSSCRLSECQPYTALSYVWGKLDDTFAILIEDSELQITRNLYLLLKAIRSPCSGKSKRLWADQICISQNNVQERNHQVARMAEIYQNASSVLAWLGDTNKHIETMFTQLNDFRACSKICNDKEIDNFLSALHRSERVRWFQMIDGLNEVCGKDYWERVWTRQEILLGHDARLVCGRTLLPWELWTLLVHKLKTHLQFSSYLNHLDTTECFKLCSISQRQVEQGHPWVSTSLHGILLEAGGGICSDIRDYVFGLVGLLNDPASFTVDYSLSPLELFWKVLYFEPLLDRQGSLRITRFLLASLRITPWQVWQFAPTSIDSLTTRRTPMSRSRSVTIPDPARSGIGFTRWVVATDVLNHFSSYGLFVTFHYYSRPLWYAAFLELRPRSTFGEWVAFEPNPPGRGYHFMPYTGYSTPNLDPSELKSQFQGLWKQGGNITASKEAPHLDLPFLLYLAMQLNAIKASSAADYFRWVSSSPKPRPKDSDLHNETWEKIANEEVHPFWKLSVEDLHQNPGGQTSLTSNEETSAWMDKSDDELGESYEFPAHIPSMMDI